MQFSKHPQPSLSLDSVALTDIIMNMFIFFFITFSFLATFNQTREGQVDVSLPKASSAAPQLERTRLTVSLDKGGGLFLNEQETSLEQLQDVFQAEREKGSEVTLVVRADQEVQHGRVVSVMDLARTEGLHRLAIATVK
jgi:biopolymer transport protein ExbD